VSFSNTRTLGYPPNFKKSEFSSFDVGESDKVLMAWVLQMIRGVVFLNTPLAILSLNKVGDALVVVFTNENASKLKTKPGFNVNVLSHNKAELAIGDEFPPNFPLEEFTKSGTLKLELGQHLRNMKAMAWMLQVLRQYLWIKKPIGITNAYRNLSEYNRLLFAGWKPAPDSFHNSGLGVDIVVLGVPAHRVQTDIKTYNLPLAVGKMAQATHLNPSETGYRDFPY